MRLNTVSDAFFPFKSLNGNIDAAAAKNRSDADVLLASLVLSLILDNVNLVLLFYKMLLSVYN